MASWRKNGVIDTFYPKIINGMLNRGYTREFAERVFEQIRGFGEYGFPESHAASFAILVYASAWIKRHHPAVFCAALLNSQPMGFYAPAQIVIDARAHGVEVRAVDVNESEWDCTLESSSSMAVSAMCSTKHGRDAHATGGDKTTWGRGGPAVRLGFHRIKGMQEKHANVIVDIRKHLGRFESVEQMHRLTGLPVSVMRRLAEADAFESLALTRRQALWHVMRPSDEELPLWECANSGDEEIPVALPVMPIGQEVMTDYATGGLSLKAHPCALIRQQLDARRIITAAELVKLDRGWVRVAGLVLIRQRPGTASGIVFETLEDETGVVNLIVRPDIYERFRPAARYAGLLECHGYVERQGKVVHVMAKRLFDLSPLLSGYPLESRDFH
jgi:error-prone DNA polymerase